jgi:hypothetical protein
MSIEQLDYEGTLRALQEFIGSRVLVSIGARSSEYVGANIVGQLFSGGEIDMGAQIPELEGDFAGESIVFSIGDPSQPATIGGFTLWNGGFEWGRRVPRPGGFTISVCIAGLVIRVRAAPPWTEIQGS